MAPESGFSHVVGLIADDLTGALDAAAPFARLGLATRVVLVPSADTAAQVVALSTETRDDALAGTERVAHAFQQLEGLGVELVFKKIDSTLRGDFGAEVTAVLDRLPPGAIALICPAHPATGRTVVDGAVVVAGEPGRLEIARRLAEPTARLVIDGQDRVVHPHGPRLVIADASSAVDLLELVDWALASSHPVLLVGSGGLASALALRMSSRVEQPGATPDTRSHHPGPVLVVAGSRHPRTAAQLAALPANLPVVALPLESIDEPDTWEKLADAAYGSAVDALALTAPADRAIDAHRLESRLADVAAGIVRQGIAGLVLTGGATARAVLDRLGVVAVDLEGELRPGVPIGHAVGGGCDGLLIVTKAGGFGEPDTIELAIVQIREKTREYT
ncbi:MAG: serine kinase [Rhodoglobus sp.]|nr:serine kinase [Rhodoglobus sp.]